ncbi:dihydrofolate reductase [Rufibacter glacialis]|uniref:Dihydrofolate reductase n=1 Tax=Rufibacter glacialis TaxID=1259555 RepID=A0A5M8QNJ8_9BACT|nr:dihydrofolate reductase [Rufibacter glacialis]KAA6437715.1 dihydrofolate reductase [Rufibacter glacialis]GGK56958.1 dihydrofolate reductase [Rufibacter glacialis]
MIALVVAIAENRVIGKDNQLIWHLPKDLQHFKKLTMGHPMVMGRKTFDAIGKPLPGRTSIIVTRQPEYQAPEGCVVTSSLEKALEHGLALDEQVLVVGGGDIYRQALPLAEVVYLTLVHESFEGDVFFPELEADAWEVTEQEEHYPDEKHAFPFTFFTFRRKAGFSQN